MVFESLYESAQRQELILVEGGICRWHLRRDGQITIYEILSTRPGAGTEMLNTLKAKGAAILARCPADLESNKWYQKKGFELSATEQTKSGRQLNVWILK